MNASQWCWCGDSFSSLDLDQPSDSIYIFIFLNKGSVLICFHPQPQPPSLPFCSVYVNRHYFHIHLQTTGKRLQVEIMYCVAMQAEQGKLPKNTLFRFNLFHFSLLMYSVFCALSILHVTLCSILYFVKQMCYGNSSVVQRQALGQKEGFPLGCQLSVLLFSYLGERG